jgi:hypothetical protein
MHACNWHIGTDPIWQITYEVYKCSRRWCVICLVQSLPKFSKLWVRRPACAVQQNLNLCQSMKTLEYKPCYLPLHTIYKFDRYIMYACQILLNIRSNTVILNKKTFPDDQRSCWFNKTCTADASSPR